MSTTVPMATPATAVKNSDGTYTVRIQHTVGGTVTEVNFTNPYFAETLAKAYAAMLNGTAVVDAKVAQLVTDAKPALADAEADLSRLVDAAEKEAKNILDAAKLEAGKIKLDVEEFNKQLTEQAKSALAEAKAEAEKLLAEAKTEAAKLLHAAATKIDPPAPAAKSVVEDEN